jgi:transposase-like protein
MAKKDEKEEKKDQVHYKPEAQVLILLEACYSNDTVVADKYGITPRTLFNWRKKLVEDKEFSETFILKKEEFEATWLDSMRKSIISGATFIQRAANEAEDETLRNPEMVRAIAGAIKICSDVILTGGMINARIAKFAGENQSEDRQNSTTGGETANGYTH